MLAVDPYFTRIPLWQVLLGRPKPNRSLIHARLPACDDILVTHAHFDHLMDVPEAARFTGARVHGSANSCRLLDILGVPGEQVHPIRRGDELALGLFKVKVLPAEHLRLPGFNPGRLPDHLQAPLRARDYRMDDCFSFLVMVDELRILVAAGKWTEQAEAADILLVNPILRLAELRALLGRVQPRVVVPIHWDDFFHPLSNPVKLLLKPPSWSIPPLGRSDLKEFERAVAQVDPAVQVLIPEMFSLYKLH